MRRLARALRHDAGAAAVEFALIFPVLMAMIAGVIEFGRILYAENAVRAVIDEAVRTAVLKKYSALDTQAMVETALEAQVAEVTGIDDLEVAVTDACTFSIDVTVTYDVLFTGYLGLELGPAMTFSLSASYPKC